MGLQSLAIMNEDFAEDGRGMEDLGGGDGIVGERDCDTGFRVVRGKGEGVGVDGLHILFSKYAKTR